MVTRDGRVKILDFGLAQVSSDADAGDADPTVTLGLTAPGTASGGGHVHKEQRAGRRWIRARTCGRWAAVPVWISDWHAALRSEGPASPVIFEAILGKAPVPVRERNPKIPVELERIIARLLEKDREMRYQSAADVRVDLKRLERDSTATGVATLPRRSRAAGWKYAILAAAALLVLSAGGFFTTRQRTSLAPLPIKTCWCWPISPTPPATRSLTGHSVKSWPSGWRSRLS